MTEATGGRVRADRTPSPGRPRRPGLDEDVLRATVRHLVRDGYAGMSVARIAADAGTTRPTVYLRWPTKQALVVEAVRHTLGQPPRAVPRSWRALPPEERLLRLLREMRPTGGGEQRLLYATLSAECGRVPDLLTLLGEEIVEPRVRLVGMLLEEMKERGEVRADVDTGHAAAMLFGVRFVDSLRAGPGEGDADREDDPDRKSVALLWRAVAADPV